LVRIAQVKRFAHAMIARAIEGNVCSGQSSQGVGERGARRIENREVIEPRAIRRRRRPRFAFPGVESDVMMIAAGGNERGLRTVALSQFETEDATVELQRAFDVRDLEMDMADANAGIDWRCHSS